MQRIITFNDFSEKPIEHLESGQVLYFPKHDFPIKLEEQAVMDPNVLAANRKNVSYSPPTQRLSGFNKNQHRQALLQQLMQRYATYATELINTLMPEYSNHISIGRTSFRPAEIAGRKPASPRKDDTRLHIDAFPSTPMRDRRILRVFSNINPQQQPRLWRLGEKFENVVKYFLTKVSPPIPLTRHLMYWSQYTHSYRSLYDHYMLRIHNQMKQDREYQQNVAQEQVGFAAGSSWIVFTDVASHAVHRGQFALEQTFYLPVNAMCDPQKSPLKILEQHLKKPLL